MAGIRVPDRDLPYTEQDRQLKKALLIEAVERTGCFAVACRLVGVPERTMRYWREADVQFDLDIDAAFARFLERQLEKIDAAGRQPKTWAAAGWLLERLNPEQFATKESVMRALKDMLDRGDLTVEQVAKLAEQ